MKTLELVERLELEGPAALRLWLGRLPDWGLVEQSGRTTATRYFVPPRLLREADLDRQTTLTRIQPHRLRALVLEDLERFPGSSISDVHRRIGPEIPARMLKRMIDRLVEEGRVSDLGDRRWRRYNARSPIDQEDGHGR